MAGPLIIGGVVLAMSGFGGILAYYKSAKQEIK